MINVNKIIEDNLFIFEMANNHNGSVDHGIKIIKEMAKISRKYSINGAVKLQYRHLDTFIHKEYINNNKNKHIKRFLSTKLSNEQYLDLVESIKNENLISICTPFDEKSVELIVNHGIDIIKVASCSANDWSLLEEISKAQKHVICSTGGLSLNEIDKVVSFFQHRNVNFSLLHCVGLYPMEKNKANLNFIDKLRKRFPGIYIGYSGHEEPNSLDVVKIAVSKGAKIFEKHIGIAMNDIPLNSYSMSPEQTDNWVNSAMEAIEICGLSEKKVTQSELDSLNMLKRGVYAQRKIGEGKNLTTDKVYFAFPIQEEQTNAFQYHETMVTSREYEEDEPIFEKRLIRSKVDFIRSIVHEVKGMLHEANIILGNDIKIELSHHYGLERFRKYGAVIVDIINRVYCKKLLIVLPGQTHPTHYHKIKEETFQVLYGEIEININKNQIIKLKAGDSLLVEPMTSHSFSSTIGAIVEEISTTHIKGDSVYEDSEINRKDLIERKTSIDNI